MAEIILRGPEQKLPSDSFGKLCYDSLQEGGCEIAMVDGVSGEETTYKEIFERSISLAQYMKNFGLTKNDTISICSENSIYFTIPILSSLYLGITVAPLNHHYTIRELVHALKISKPKVIFCASAVLDNIIKASKEIKSVQEIIILNKSDKLPRSLPTIHDFFSLQTSQFEVTAVDVDHATAILCSSGTTGMPKGVLLTHKNFHAAFDYLKRPGYGNYHSGKIGMGLLPFYHAYGFISHLSMVMRHAKVIVLPRFEEKLFLSSIQKYRIEIATLVPPLILFLAKSPIVDNYDLSSLQEITCGAAPLSKEIQDAVMKRLNVKIRQGYGLTELTLAATYLPSSVTKTGTTGVLTPGLECKVVDIETGQSLGPNKKGELCFRGSQIMKEYVGNKEATEATIDKNGWLHSGDIGYYDNDEFFYVVDRLKELIKYKGFQVPPAELEGILMQLPEILDCGVIGKPDEEAGELPTAFVVKKPNSTITENDIVNYIKENVSYHKRLHGGVYFVDSIPKSPTGKILRRILKEQFKSPASKL